MIFIHKVYEKIKKYKKKYKIILSSCNKTNKLYDVSPNFEVITAG